MDYSQKVTFVDWTRINIWCCNQFFTSSEISMHTDKVHFKQKEDLVKNDNNLKKTEGIKSVYSLYTKSENNNQILKTNTAEKFPFNVCVKNFEHEKSLKRHKRNDTCEINKICSESPKITQNNEVVKENKSDERTGVLTKNKLAEDETKKDEIKTPARRFVWTRWETDKEMLPEGWIKRSHVNAKDVRVYQYRNNDKKAGKIFQSKKEVFAFMKNSKTCSLDDALKFLSVVRKQEDGEDAFKLSKEVIQYEFDCNYCPQQFFTSNEKGNHEQQEHAGQIRFNCNECGFGDLKKLSLFYHVQSKHLDVQRPDKVTFDAEVPPKMEILNSIRMSTLQPRATRAEKKIYAKGDQDPQIYQENVEKFAKSYNQVIKFDEINAETGAKEAASKEVEEIVIDDSDEESDSDLSPKELKSCEICDFTFTSCQNASVHFFSDHLKEINVIWKDLIGIKAGKHTCKLCRHAEDHTGKNVIKLHIFNDHSDEFEKIVFSTGYFSSNMLLLLMVKLPVELINGLKETVLNEDIENHCEDGLEDTSSCNNNQENVYKEYLDKNSLETNFDDDIQFVECITKQDWVVDLTLPEGWKRRPFSQDYNQSKEDRSMVVKKYQYMSPDGLVFDSRKKIFEYMDINTHIPNQDQILNWQLPVDYEQEGDIEDKQSEMDECDSQLDEQRSFVDDTQVPVQESEGGREGCCVGDGQEEISD